MSTAYRLVPWTQVARPHSDVTSGALEMGTYAANLAAVFRGRAGAPDVYARADRFFAATYVTPQLRRLLEDVLGAIAGHGGDRVLQLRTPFGGGKTHTLLALLHLARDRAASADVPELAGLPDPGPVRIAVLSGEELDPLRPTRSVGGIETRTLWGELGAQLGRYDAVAQHDRLGSAPGGDTLREVLGDEPVIVLLDEVLVYVEKGMAIVRGDSTLGRQAMLFMQSLTETVNNLPRAAMVYSLQASVGEAVGAEGLLMQLDHLVSRIDAKREPVSGDEVMRVVQRRLFSDLGDVGVQRQVAAQYADLVRRQLEAQAESADARREAELDGRRLEERILASYPFHPALLDLMYHRWGSLPSYQRTRGALQFLACVVHDLWQRGDDSSLIGPGEVNLGDPQTRGAFFSQVGERERYQAVIDGDIVSSGSGAGAVDRRIGQDSPALAQLRVGTRAASSIMLFSFGAREGEERGVLESDLVAAMLVPGLDRNIVVAALHDLREEELYLHVSARRYRYEPRPNLTKLVRDEAASFGAEEILEHVRQALEEQLRATADARTARGIVIWPSGPERVRDRVPIFSVVYLHPDWTPASLPLERFVEEAGGAKRVFKNAVCLVLPDRSQFDRAREAARTQCAAESLVGRRARLGLTQEQVAELTEKGAAAKQDLTSAVAHAYDRAAIAVRSTEGDRPYGMEQVDLRTLLTTGRGLQQRVLEALSHRVFDRITVDRLITLIGLGPEHKVVRCADIVDWFFSLFEFTKLVGADPLRDAIANGVFEGRFAYALGVEVVDGLPRVRDPGLVRLKTMMAKEEIDLGLDAALLTYDLAIELIRRSPGADSAVSQGGGSGEPGAGSDLQGVVADATLDGGEEDPDSTDRRGSPTDAIHTLAMRLRFDARGIFALQRALSWLRERSTSMDIEVMVRAAAKPEGYDPIGFRNGVVEPLVEQDVDQHIELS